MSATIGDSAYDWKESLPDSALVHSLVQISGLGWLLVVVARPTSWSYDMIQDERGLRIISLIFGSEPRSRDVMFNGANTN
jgi:hypothetical protein